MGATPWGYFVPFEVSVKAALAKLRSRVFKSGEYQGSEMNPATPEEAMMNMDAEGTASILDILLVSDSPSICAVCPLSPAKLTALFGGAQPTHETVESNGDLYEDIGRGEGIYITVYKDGKPDGYFFAGYSFD